MDERNKREKIEGQSIYLEQLFQNSPEAIARMDKNNRIIEINEHFTRVFGYKLEEIKGRDIDEVLVPEDLREEGRYLSDAVLNGEKVSIETIRKKKNGEAIDVSIIGCPVSVRGELRGLYGIYRDISERIEAKEEVSRSEEKFRAIFEGAIDAVFIENLKGDILDVNDAACDLLGYSREELKGMNVSELLPDYLKRDINDLIKRELKDGGFRMEGENVAKDGTVIPVEVSTNMVDMGKRKCVVAIVRDIRERKKMEEKLKESKQTYESIYKTTVALYKEKSFENIIRIITDRATELLNARDGIFYRLDRKRGVLVPVYSNNVEVRDEIMSFEVPLGKGLSGKVAETGLSDYTNFGEENYSSFHVDGTEVEEESLISVPTFEDDKVIGVITLGKIGSRFNESDIDKLKIFARQAELAIMRAQYMEEIQKSEKKYRTVINEVHDAIFIYSGDKFLFLNDRVCELSGFSREELLEKRPLELVHPDDREKFIEFERRRKEGERVTDKFEVRLVTQEGEIRYGDFALKEIQYKNVEAILGAVRDITEYREMEEEIRKSDKLKSIGKLAGGIAHDFNNLLAGIIGNISLLKMEIEEKKLLEIMEESEKAARRAEKLTKKLLTFSSGGAPVVKTENIEPIIEESVEFALTGSNVKCEFELEENLKKVKVDRGQINQVMNNIIINADQSMPSGGTIHIRAENFWISPDERIPLIPGNYIRISITDEGKGIKEKDIPNIFDPFFTTREDSRGLGLSTAYSIVEKHNGYIDVESNEGEGSTFHVYLPSAEGDFDMETEYKRKRTECGKVLLMDDEEIIRKTARRMIENTGFEVVTARDGREAIEKFKSAMEKNEPFNLVIMDLTVPGGMGGKDAIKELKKIDPEVKVFVSSGYSNDPVMSDYKKYGFSGIIPKPYETADLLNIILNT